MERANWFAPEGVAQEDHWSFRRSNWFEHVGAEVKNVTENVGVLDMSAFAKARVEGPGAEAFLEYLTANKLPRKMAVSPWRMLWHLVAVFILNSPLCVNHKDSFYIVSAGAAQRLDHYVTGLNDRSVTFTDLTNSMGVLVLAGPKSRELLQRLTLTDLSNANFPWLSAQKIDVHLAPSIAARVNFVGELGWELHHPIEYQESYFRCAIKAGEDLGIKPFGIRAMDAMRLEKSYRMVGTEMSIEYAAFESGLERFVNMQKENFIGRDGLAAWQEKGFNNSFATLKVHDTIDADPIGGNPIYQNGELVGRCTSGGYGFRVGYSIALAMVKPELADIGQIFEIDILGTRFKTEVIEESPFDPNNDCLRA